MVQAPPFPATPRGLSPSSCLTNSHIGRQVVAIVEADEAQVGDMRSQQQQQEGPEGTGHSRVLQPHGPAPPSRVAQLQGGPCPGQRSLSIPSP